MWLRLCLCDGAWLQEADASLLHWRPLLPFFPSLLSFITPSYLISQQLPPLSLPPFLPPLPSQQSDHPSTLAPPLPRLSFSFALMSLSLALVGCWSQTSRSNLSILLTLPPSAFPFLSIDSTFPAPCRCSRISVCASSPNYFSPHFLFLFGSSVCRGCK